MQRDQFKQQHQNNDTFYRACAVNAQVLLEIKNTQLQE